MRDMMMFFGMLALVPMSLMSTFGAYLLWGWTGVLTPANYLYGFMQGVRYNLMFALITMVLMLLRGAADKGKIESSPTVVLLAAFAIHSSLCAAFGYANNPFNLDYYSNLLKILVFVLFMPVLLTKRYRVHAVLIMILLGLGLHGVLEGLKYLASGGGHKVEGIPMSMIGDNNHFATALVMSVPIAYYLFTYSANKLVRFGFLCTALLLVVAVVGSYSRGAFVSLSVVGAWLVFKSRNKLMTALIVIVAAGGIMFLAADTWFDRISTIQTANNDSSFMGRVSAWRASSAIALQNPVFGGGFHSLQVGYVWAQFRFETGLFPFIDVPAEFVRDLPRAAHSIYFEVLGDQGFVGFAIFLALLVNAQLTSRKVRRLAKEIGSKADWARDLSNMLSVSLLAYMVGGASVSLAYYEIVYVLMMLIEVLRIMLSKQLKEIDNTRKGQDPLITKSTSTTKLKTRGGFA